MKPLTAEISDELGIPKPHPSEPAWNPIMLRYDRFEQALEAAYRLGQQAAVSSAQSNMREAA